MENVSGCTGGRERERETWSSLNPKQAASPALRV